jgi:hypothetical protein
MSEMRQPLSRERQIELASDYQQRIVKHAEKLLRVSTIRESISRAHPKQGERANYVSKSVRGAKCG